MSDTLLYVSPTGDDEDEGSFGEPFATVDGARTAVAALVAAGLTANVIVYIRAGTYRLSSPITFTPEDSDETCTYTVAYRAYPGETPVLNGTVDVSGSWTLVADGVYSIDLAGQSVFNALYVNGELATRARWPSKGDYHLMDAYPDHEDVPRPIYHDHFYFDPVAGLPTLPAADVTANLPEVVLFDDYNVQRYKYDTSDADQVWVHTDSRGHGINYFSHYNRYYWENNLSFLTDEGEWYFDSLPATPVLYYKPTAAQLAGDADLSEMVVEIPVVESLIEVHGDEPTLACMNGDTTLSLWFNTSYSEADDWQKTLLQNWTAEGTNSGINIDIRTEYSGETLQREGYIHIDYMTDDSCSDWTSGFHELNDGQWHHLAVSFQAPTVDTAGLIRMWVDGVEEDHWLSSMDNTIAANLIPDNAHAPWIGYYSVARSFEGYIDSVVILDRAITTDLDAYYLKERQYTTLADDIVFNLRLQNSFDLECDTITGVESAYSYPISNGVVYDTEISFAAGDGDHEKCAKFTAANTKERISTSNRPGRRVHKLEFEGLTLYGTDCPDIGTAGMTPEIADEYDLGAPGAIDLKYGHEIDILNCTIHDVAGPGIYSMLSEDCNIISNTLYNIGMYGIVMDTPDRYCKGEKNWEGHTINQNTIHDIGLIYLASSAIQLVSTSRSQINRNYIYNIPRIAISCNNRYDWYDGNWADIEVGYNYCHDCLQKVNHNGVLRLNGRAPGSRYHHNVVLNTRRTSDHEYRRTDEGEDYPLGYGIHFDQGAGGCSIDHNLVVNTAGGAAMRWNGCREIVCENNIFVGPKAGGGLFLHNYHAFKFGPDGDYVYSYDNTIQNNVMYTNVGNNGTTGDVTWLPDYSAATSTILAVFTGTQDNNCYWANGDDPLGKWNSAGGIFGSQTINPLTWAFSTLEVDENSISEDPAFRMNDTLDFFVTNANVLALGFENFVGDLPGNPHEDINGLDDGESCLALLKFDDASGSSAVDSSSNSNYFSLIGSYAWGTGKYSGGCDFPASPTSYARRSRDSSFELSEYTYAFWAKHGTTKPTNLQTLYSGGNDSANRNPGIYLNASGKVIASNRNGVPLQELTGATDLCDGSWHHICVTCDGVSLFLYIDGELDAFDSDVEDYLGGYSATAAYNYIAYGTLVDTSIDDFRVYTRPLSYREISILANNPYPSSEGMQEINSPIRLSVLDPIQTL